MTEVANSRQVIKNAILYALTKKNEPVQAYELIPDLMDLTGFYIQPNRIGTQLANLRDNGYVEKSGNLRNGYFWSLIREPSPNLKILNIQEVNK